MGQIESVVMPLYCSLEMFQGLAGAKFPATKRQLLDYAKQHDAPEAAVVVLNQLADATFMDIAEVCHNAGIVCSIEAAQALAGVTFPATKAEMLEAVARQGASQAVVFALEALPDGVPFSRLEDVCTSVL